MQHEWYSDGTLELQRWRNRGQPRDVDQLCAEKCVDEGRGAPARALRRKRRAPEDYLVGDEEENKPCLSAKDRKSGSGVTRGRNPRIEEGCAQGVSTRGRQQVQESF